MIIFNPKLTDALFIVQSIFKTTLNSLYDLNFIGHASEFHLINIKHKPTNYYYIPERYISVAI